MLKPAILALIRQILTVAGTALVAKGFVQASEVEPVVGAVLTRRVFARLGGPSEDERGQMADLWSHFIPAKSGGSAESRELGQALRALRQFLAPPEAAQQ